MSPYNGSFNIRHKKKHTFSRSVFLGFGIIACIIALWFIFRLILSHEKNDIPAVYPDVVNNAFESKRALISKVTELETTIQSYDARLSELAVLKDENEKLKAELGRGAESKGVLAHILTLPNRSIYGTIGIDAGTKEGVQTGATAYAFGNIALGTITYAGDHNSMITLFSAAGKETTGTVSGSDVAVTLIGRSNGEYEVRMPRDVHFDIGSMIEYQSAHTAILAQIEKVASDPRDPFQRLYAKVPVNLQALKWVIVR